MLRKADKCFLFRENGSMSILSFNIELLTFGASWCETRMAKGIWSAKLVLQGIVPGKTSLAVSRRSLSLDPPLLRD